MKGGYNEKIVRKQVLRSKEHSRKDVLEREEKRDFRREKVYHKYLSGFLKH